MEPEGITCVTDIDGCRQRKERTNPWNIPTVQIGKLQDEVTEKEVSDIRKRIIGSELEAKGKKPFEETDQL